MTLQMIRRQLFSTLENIFYHLIETSVVIFLLLLCVLKSRMSSTNLRQSYYCHCSVEIGLVCSRHCVRYRPNHNENHVSTGSGTPPLRLHDVHVTSAAVVTSRRVRCDIEEWVDDWAPALATSAGITKNNPRPCDCAISRYRCNNLSTE